MYVYSMLEGGVNAKLEKRIGAAVKPTLEGRPAISVIVRKNSRGGVDSPAAYIMDPVKTIVIAGANNDAGMDFAETAAEQGVPEENIFFAPLSLKDLAAKIKELLSAQEKTKEASQEQETPASMIEPEEETGWSSSRVKTIAVLGFRGGVGKSTIATSLADHYRGNGEVVAIVDLGSPPTAYRHFGLKELTGEPKNGFILLRKKVDIFVPEAPYYDFPSETLVKAINDLKKEYRRVIIDYPSEPRQSHLDVNIDCPVIVVDYDMVLSVKKDIDGIIVYNKAIPEVPTDIVSEILGSKPVTIKMDIEYCIAALVSAETAYQTSGNIAEGIGNLAARIG